MKMKLIVTIDVTTKKELERRDEHAEIELIEAKHELCGPNSDDRYRKKNTLSVREILSLSDALYEAYKNVPYSEEPCRIQYLLLLDKLLYRQAAEFMAIPTKHGRGIVDSVNSVISRFRSASCRQHASPCLHS